MFGRWGAGKSTLLKLVEKNIEERDETKKKFVCISLNSWVFEGYDDAKSAIMESLLRTLMDNQPAFERLEDEIKSLIGRINFMKLGATAIKYGMPLVMNAINPATATLTMAQYFSKTKRKEILNDIKQAWSEKEVEEDKDTTVENIRLFRKEFGDLINKSKIDNLIVMIDDLDRCTPERVIETLEAVKLFLSVPKTTFIIAVDNQVMKYSIENKYPKITEDSEDFSDSYIEKIIQLPISIPELSETDIKNYLLLLICELYLSKGVLSIKANQLDILLSKVKKDNIFVNGIKIDLEFVKSAFKQYDYTILDEGTIDEFEKMFDIIGKSIDISEEYLEKFKEDYKIGMAFVKNERFSNPDTGKTTDLKAVLLAVHNYLKHGSKDYYTQKLISLGGMDMQEIEKYVEVYMKSMGELYDFIKEQARLNGNELLQFIEGKIDE